MKKLTSIILVLLIAVACSNGISEKDIIGKYKATIVTDSENKGEGAEMALAMFASANIQYDFQKDGILKNTVSMGQCHKIILPPGSYPVTQFILM